MLEFAECANGNFDVFTPDKLQILCTLSLHNGEWMSFDHDTESFRFDSRWHRQIADKLEELNGK